MCGLYGAFSANFVVGRSTSAALCVLLSSMSLYRHARYVAKYARAFTYIYTFTNAHAKHTNISISAESANVFCFAACVLRPAECDCIWRRLWRILRAPKSVAVYKASIAYACFSHVSDFAVCFVRGAMSPYVHHLFHSCFVASLQVKETIQSEENPPGLSLCFPLSVFASPFPLFCF